MYAYGLFNRIVLVQIKVLLNSNNVIIMKQLLRALTVRYISYGGWYFHNVTQYYFILCTNVTASPNPFLKDLCLTLLHFIRNFNLSFKRPKTQEAIAIPLPYDGMYDGM